MTAYATINATGTSSTTPKFRLTAEQYKELDAFRRTFGWEYVGNLFKKLVTANRVAAASTNRAPKPKNPKLPVKPIEELDAFKPAVPATPAPKPTVKTTYIEEKPCSVCKHRFVRTALKRIGENGKGPLFCKSCGQAEITRLETERLAAEEKARQAEIASRTCPKCHRIADTVREILNNGLVCFDCNEQGYYCSACVDCKKHKVVSILFDGRCEECYNKYVETEWYCDGCGQTRKLPELEQAEGSKIKLIVCRGDVECYVTACTKFEKNETPSVTGQDDDASATTTA